MVVLFIFLVKCAYSTIGDGPNQNSPRWSILQSNKQITQKQNHMTDSSEI
jgi:hypothetical protein